MAPAITALALLPAVALAAGGGGVAFEILSLTPSTDSARVDAPARHPVRLAGREALTLTFSRAMIALGSDYAPGALPAHLTPFTLEPPVDGRMRWVTTSIARFDPAEDWPSELEIQLRLNPTLRSFDGLELSPSGPTSWPFRTPHLSMSSGSVRSPSASALTNGSWSATLHSIEPGAAELPSDGTIGTP